MCDCHVCSVKHPLKDGPRWAEGSLAEAVSRPDATRFCAMADAVDALTKAARELLDCDDSGCRCGECCHCALRREVEASEKWRKR